MQLQSLSPRELDTFIRLGRGERIGEIAVTLGLSVKTVSTFRARALKKMGLTRLAQVVAYCLTHQDDIEFLQQP